MIMVAFIYRSSPYLQVFFFVTGLGSMVTIKMQQKQQQNARHYPLHIIYNEQIWLRATIYFILHTTKHQMFFLTFLYGSAWCFLAPLLILY